MLAVAARVEVELRAIAGGEDDAVAELRRRLARARGSSSAREGEALPHLDRRGLLVDPGQEERHARSDPPHVAVIALAG